MKRFQLKHLFFITLFLLTLQPKLTLAEEQIRFASLNWPPYGGLNLPEQGLSSVILRAAFKAEGYTNIRIDILPWSRALSMTENDENTIGCLNAYYSDERANKFYVADSLLSSPMAIIERLNNQVKWKHFIELKGNKIGVVQDYVNTNELDDLFSKKIIQKDIAIDDETNLSKLAHSRVDLAIIDINVFNYLMTSNSQLIKFKSQLKINSKFIENKKLYVLFKKNKLGKKYSDIFNRGISKIDTNAITKAYMNSLIKFREP